MATAAPSAVHTSSRWRLSRSVGAIFSIIVGGAFLWAAVQSAMDPLGKERVLRFVGVPTSIVPPVLLLILAAEAAIGAGLISNTFGVLWRSLGLMPLMIYTALLVFLYTSTDAPDCSCLRLWNEYSSARTGHLLGIGRNTMFAAMLLTPRR